VSRSGPPRPRRRDGKIGGIGLTGEVHLDPEIIDALDGIASSAG
jgi:hypothetical protein